ncbi:glycosyltransferase family 2 protein [Candidatus Peregrinibacteria bacterium]|nr:glycosyltransferase family 2 protein [Candidatus Peregrinibacteria bacterium]
MQKTPEEISELKKFGWGEASDEELQDKTAVVKVRMAARSTIAGQPRMSVVVPVYQEQNYLLGTLLSLAAQTHRNIEFIIVSNGEPYGNVSQQIAEQSGFTVIHESKKGWANAHMAGLEATRGEIYATTDADTLHYSDWLTTVDEVFHEQNCMAATAHVHFIDVKPARKIYRLCADTYKRLFERSGIYLMRGAWGANSFYQRTALQEAGGYTGLRRDIWADTAVLYRVLPHGGEIMMEDQHAQVFSSARRMNQTPISRSIIDAVRHRLHARGIGVNNFIKQDDVR